MTSSPVPVIVAGCGAVTNFFYAAALAYLELRGVVKVVALCDPNEANRAAVHSRFPGARSLAKFEDAPFSAESLVIVASPPTLHARQAILALERGCAVLCEKPMAASLPEAEAMIAAAEKTQRPLAIGLYRRFFSSAQTIKDLISGGALGKVVSFKIEEGGPFRWEAASESFFLPEVTPGGVLYDSGVHTLDLVVWWFGEPDSFRYADDASGGLEANCILAANYDGFSGEVRLSRDWDTRNTARIDFERGSVSWQVSQAGQLALRLDGVEGVLAGGLHPLRDDGFRLQIPDETEGAPQAFIRQILDLVAAIREGTPVKISASEGVRSLRLIKSCYENRVALDMPWIHEGIPAQTTK